MCDRNQIVLIDINFHRALAIKMMVVSATIVSTAGLIFRSLDAIDAFEVVFFRGLALTLSMIMIISFFYKDTALKATRSIGYSGLLGAAFFTGAQTFYVFAFSNTTVANSTFTIATAPFITAFLAWLVLREIISKITLVAMVSACFGVLFIVLADVTSEGKLGIAFAFLTACCFSCFAVILRYNKNVEMLPVLLFTGIFSMAIGLIFGEWKGMPLLSDVGLCFLWGGILQGVGQSLLVLSTKVLKAAEVPLIMLLEFTLGPVWVWLVYDENISLGTLFGGSLIFISIFGFALFEINKKKLSRI